MSFRDQWIQWGRCLAGTLGGLGGGIFAGAAVGPLMPVLGVLGCSILGGIAGLLSGAAAACSE